MAAASSPSDTGRSVLIAVLPAHGPPIAAMRAEQNS
jgi:hypothetical protein